MLNLFIVLRVQRRQRAFQLGARRRVLFHRNLVFQLNDLRVHRQYSGAQAFQFTNRRLTLIQRATQVRSNTFLLLVQHPQLPLQQLYDGIRFANQILQLVVNRRCAHPLLTQALGLALGEHTNKALPAGLITHLVKIFGKSFRHIIKPHDQLGNIGVHQLGMGVHIVERRIFDIYCNIIPGGHLGAGCFNPAAQF